MAFNPAPNRVFGPRQAILAACLVGAVCALVAVRIGVSGEGTSAAVPETGVFAPGCPAHDAPEAALAAPASLAQLGGQLRALLGRGSRIYEAGMISARNMWTDDTPMPLAGLPRAGLEPGGYEVRWWSGPSEYHLDDIAADAVVFTDESAAEQFLARASSPRCRHESLAVAAPFPDGARDLFWVNPDDALQWDVLFARGRVVYRVADVAPTWLLRRLSGGGAVRAWERGRISVDLLACRLAAARCGGGPGAPHLPAGA